jgi:hypothetical protein
MAHRGTWHTPGTIDISSANLASRFDIVDGCVARYQRFDDLQNALASAGLDESHEVQSQGDIG